MIFPNYILFFISTQSLPISEELVSFSRSLHYDNPNQVEISNHYLDFKVSSKKIVHQNYRVYQSLEFYTIELIYRYPQPELIDRFAGDNKGQSLNASVFTNGKGFMKLTEKMNVSNKGSN